MLKKQSKAQKKQEWWDTMWNLASQYGIEMSKDKIGNYLDLSIDNLRIHIRRGLRMARKGEI